MKKKAAEIWFKSDGKCLSGLSFVNNNGLSIKVLGIDGNTP